MSEKQTDEDAAYAEAIVAYAGHIETYLRRHPERSHLTQGKYDVIPPGDSVECLRTIEISLYDAIKDDEPDMVQHFFGMTGMQWDIALGLARHRLGLGSTPQSSLLEI